MTKKLKPVVGLAVAGLIGTTYATCYWSVTHLCVSGGTQVGAFGSCFHPIYAQGDWFVYDWASTIGSGTGHQSLKSPQPRCSGQASYTDCQGFNHTIQSYTPDPGWGAEYDAPDPASPTCST